MANIHYMLYKMGQNVGLLVILHKLSCMANVVNARNVVIPNVIVRPRNVPMVISTVAMAMVTLFTLSLLLMLHRVVHQVEHQARSHLLHLQVHLLMVQRERLQRHQVTLLPVFLLIFLQGNHQRHQVMLLPQSHH